MTQATAGDWPQWRGLKGDAVVADFTPPAAWPKELTKKWSKSIGDGVATPALVGGKLYAFGYQSGNEVVRCLDAKSGEELWKDEYAARAAGGPARDFPAARSSPAVADGKIVTLGVQGTLSCLDAEKGTKLWRKDSTGGVPGFATSSSPLLVDGMCVVQVGGERGGSLVAYNLADASERWTWKSDGTKYASPALLTVGTEKAVVVETAGTVTAVSLTSGQAVWSVNFLDAVQRLDAVRGRPDGVSTPVRVSPRGR